MFFLDVDCGGEGILKIIKFIWILLDCVKFIVPMGLIVMVMVDFAKNVISGREDDMKKNVNMVLKRVVFAMAIFLIPSIVQTAIHLLGKYGVDYAFCIDIAVNESDLSKYRTKYESGEFGDTKIVIPESLKNEKYKKKKTSSGDASSSGGNTDYGSPDWNSEAWKINRYSCMGQCTWFAWGRFYEIYGYDPGFSGNGNQCAGQLLNAHPDKFERSSKPRAGAIFSGDSAHNHVGLVVGVSGDNVTIQEGNLKGENGNILNCDSFEFAKSDWQEKTFTLAELRNMYGDITFANPKIKSQGGGKHNQVEK